MGRRRPERPAHPHLHRAGFGDAIQFARYVPMLAERGGKIIVGCRRPMQRLLETVEGIDEMVLQDEALPAFDVHCSMMSLPLLFETTIATIPAKVPYMHADRAASERWQERLLPFEGTLKIGLVWAGLPKHENDRNRSLSLEMLAPLAKVPGHHCSACKKAPHRTRPALHRRE